MKKFKVYYSNGIQCEVEAENEKELLESTNTSSITIDAYEEIKTESE